MKQLFLILLISLFTSNIFAASPPQNISVKINLNYLKNSADNETPLKYELENNLKLTTNNHKWAKIENSKDKNKSNIILLHRIVEANANNITFEFLVLDTSKNSTVIFEPKIISLYGQKSELVILDGKDILGITVLAKV